MKAVYFREYGPVEVLQLGEMPRPVPGPRQVLVEVYATCVNPRDWLLREGRYLFQRFAGKPPIIPGSDVSGVVVEIGSKVTRWRVGDEVFGMKEFLGGMMGSYAEFITIDERKLAAKPSATSHEEAAGAPLAAQTALRALEREAGLKPGQDVAIVGASGGVGSYAVQIAKAMGARVTAVCSARNVSLVRDLGADEVYDYKQESFLDRSTPYDAIFDCIGNSSLSTCSMALSRGGVYVTTIPSPKALLRSVATRMRSWLPGEAQRSRVVLVQSDGAQLQRIAEWMDAGKLRTAVDTVFPLDEVRAAHLASRSFRTRGKLILRVK
jgi:NADPH:quinone reductase-like Zn-dependent oxidoreductase